MYKPGEHDRKIIAFDYDGTLTDEDNYPEVEDLPEETREVLGRLARKGYEIIIHTSRQSLDEPEIREATEVDSVNTGKPVADLYIDDKGLYPGFDINLTEAFIEAYFDTQKDYLDKLVSGELESAYAVNIGNVPENPEYKEPQDKNFRVYIPVTGGMDSLTLWQMAIEAGYDVVPIYIDAGQEYADLEIAHAQETVRQDGHELEVISVEAPFKRFKHILLGRNALVLYTISEIMRERGQWGEIWLGNLAGESPTVGGDKSRRFLNDTQRLLTYRGYDVRIETPLIGMDKPDEVAYWLKRDIKKLVNTKSCFSENSNQCGECQTCFRKWTAFMAHDMDIRDTFDADVAVTFQPFVEKYKEVMGKALETGDYTHYSPSRIKTTLEAIERL